MKYKLFYLETDLFIFEIPFLYFGFSKWCTDLHDTMQMDLYSKSSGLCGPNYMTREYDYISVHFYYGSNVSITQL